MQSNRRQMDETNNTHDQKNIFIGAGGLHCQTQLLCVLTG